LKRYNVKCNQHWILKNTVMAKIFDHYILMNKFTEIMQLLKILIIYTFWRAYSMFNVITHHWKLKLILTNEYFIRNYSLIVWKCRFWPVLFVTRVTYRLTPTQKQCTNSNMIDIVLTVCGSFVVTTIRNNTGLVFSVITCVFDNSLNVQYGINWAILAELGWYLVHPHRLDSVDQVNLESGIYE
jgi:hypothetical protein